jgi:glycosyltransferase involved in cell wall biosynthesis
MPLDVRIVGSGPEGAALDALRRLDGVTVENRWVPEDEIAAIIAWSDALVLPYREASQSGAAAAAMAAGRFVVATAVGGLAEQLEGYPLARLCAPEPAALAHSLAALLTEAGPCAAPTGDPMAAPMAAPMGDPVGDPVADIAPDGWPAFARSILQAAGGPGRG